MDVFKEVKSRVSVRAIAEAYGLKVGRNGMACCPFHNDKHPSMKIDDKHYHCFGCGAHGDVIEYVAESFGISRYNAAIKINDDFHLGIEVTHKSMEKELQSFRKKQENLKKVVDIRKKFEEWKRHTIDALLECEQLIKACESAVMDKSPHIVFSSAGFMYMMHRKSMISYWLDILCMGKDDEVKEFFFADGKEVGRVVAGIRQTGDEILGRNRKCIG